MSRLTNRKCQNMDTKITAALTRLDSLLPLLSGLQSLSSEDAGLYCKLLQSYVEKGCTLSRKDAARHVGNVDASLDNIVNSKLIVLDTDGNPSGAYPFTSEVRVHKVHINGVTAHCMCALDVLSVSNMFNTPTVIDSRCGVTGEAIHLEQTETSFRDGTMDAWFGINWGAASSDIVCAESLCMEMIFLANERVAKEWLAQSSDTREIFDLNSAVEFSAAFFVPLAEHCQH